MTKFLITWQDAVTTAAGLAGGLALWLVVWPFAVGLFDARVPADTAFFWLLTRASGITAYVLLTASMLFGLGVSTRLFDALTPRANSFTRHEYVSWLSLGFTGLHAQCQQRRRGAVHAGVELPPGRAPGAFGTHVHDGGVVGPIDGPPPQQLRQ